MVVFLMNPVWSVYEIKTKAWVVQALGIGLYMKLDLDVVGDNAEILPLAFPDAEVGALEGKAAFKDAGIAVFLERGSEEHTSELQSLMRISYAVFCLKKKNYPNRY